MSSTSLPHDQIDEVLVVVESVSAVTMSGEVQWLVADHKPLLNLMTLQSEPVWIVSDAELPQGHYGSVTIRLAPFVEVKQADGKTAKLQVLPRERVVSIPKFDFDDGREWARLRLTFDVSRSLRDFLATSSSQTNHFNPELSASSLAFRDFN
jgi:hypothetical protein